MLRIKNANIGHDKTLYSLSELEIKQGEVIAVFGENGCGKSTLLQSIIGFIPFLDGEVENANNQQLIYLPAKPIVHPQLSVEQAILLGLSNQKKWWQNFSVEQMQMVDVQIENYQIQDLKHKLVNELSDGQQQKVWMAQAALAPADFLLLDEPSGHLDPNQSAWIFVNMYRWAKQSNKAVVFASHKLDLSLQIADKVLYIKKGKVELYDAKSPKLIELLTNDFSNKYLDYSLTKPNQVLKLF